MEEFHRNEIRVSTRQRIQRTGARNEVTVSDWSMGKNASENVSSGDRTLKKACRQSEVNSEHSANSRLF